MDISTDGIDTTGTRYPSVWRASHVAAFWQRDVRTIWRWVDAGTHPRPRRDPGGKPYWVPAEVRAFAEGHRPGTPARSGPPSFAITVS